jgi:tight adherence protein B
VIYIDLTSPGFFQLMYTTAIGKVVMTVCMVLYVLAFFISRKIMSIEI